MQLQLPEPSPEALAASSALQQVVATEIRQAGGWISFARYMELALYAPGLGYYSGGAAKLGKDGDFTTAPEITPLFGKTLANLAAGLMAQSVPHLMEFGAGTGRLAFDILTELKAQGVAVASYAIVELSGELRGRQRDLLRDFPEVQWLDSLPESFSGVVIGNEVLDAMPVELVVKTADGWAERGLRLDGARFVYEDRACSHEVVAQIPDADLLQEGYLTETHARANAFMRSVGAMLASGGKACAILLDYGFPAAEYYLAQRHQGTLMCHYRHHAHPDPLYLPGLQDITSHVDFTAMATSAIDAGAELMGYTSQAAFLLAAGLGEILMRTAPEEHAAYLRQSNAVQRLTSPAEMGELFKVLVVGKGLVLPEVFMRADRSHRL